MFILCTCVRKSPFVNLSYFDIDVLELLHSATHWKKNTFTLEVWQFQGAQWGATISKQFHTFFDSKYYELYEENPVLYWKVLHAALDCFVQKFAMCHKYKKKSKLALYIEWIFSLFDSWHRKIINIIFKNVTSHQRDGSSLEGQCWHRNSV